MREVRSSMKDPTQCKTALNDSALVQVIIYLVAGIMAVMMWRYNVADPVTVEIPREGWVGLYANIAVLVVTALDYSIAAKIANTWFQSTFLPNWSSVDTVLSKLLYTLPTTIFDIACVLVVPEFDTLVRLLKSISIMGMNT
jgi:hypothetical protein